MSARTHRRDQGFTLVELLIVVVILGILSAVVIPQFNTATAESKEAALAANLATVRQAIEMYKVQHNDSFPDTSVIAQLTAGTKLDGTAGSKYGPYLRSFPKNPINLATGVNTVGTMPGSPSGTEGWIYDTTTGEFRANVTGTAPSGAAYFGL